MPLLIQFIRQIQFLIRNHTTKLVLKCVRNWVNHVNYQTYNIVNYVHVIHIATKTIGTCLGLFALRIIESTRESVSVLTGATVSFGFAVPRGGSRVPMLVQDTVRSLSLRVY